MDWTSIAEAAREAFRDAVNDWIGKARIRGGHVRGPAAILTPGSPVSDGNIETMALQKLIAAQVSADVARTLARELATAWNGWAAGFEAQVPGAYPSFAAFPGPVAPPTPAAPIALAQGSSPGEASLKASVLAGKLSSALRAHANKVQGGSLDRASKGLADWIESSFQEWKGRTLLVGIMGKGSAPTFAPPYVPVGAVVIGDNATACIKPIRSFRYRSAPSVIAEINAWHESSSITYPCWDDALTVNAARLGALCAAPGRAGPPRRRSACWAITAGSFASSLPRRCAPRAPGGSATRGSHGAQRCWTRWDRTRGGRSTASCAAPRSGRWSRSTRRSGP